MTVGIFSLNEHIWVLKVYQVLLHALFYSVLTKTLRGWQDSSSYLYSADQETEAGGDHSLSSQCKGEEQEIGRHVAIRKQEPRALSLLFSLDFRTRRLFLPVSLEPREFWCPPPNLKFRHEPQERVVGRLSLLYVRHLLTTPYFCLLSWQVKQVTVPSRWQRSRPILLTPPGPFPGASQPGTQSKHLGV